MRAKIILLSEVKQRANLLSYSTKTNQITGTKTPKSSSLPSKPIICLLLFNLQPLSSLPQPIEKLIALDCLSWQQLQLLNPLYCTYFSTSTFHNKIIILLCCSTTESWFCYVFFAPKQHNEIKFPLCKMKYKKIQNEIMIIQQQTHDSIIHFFASKQHNENMVPLYIL